MTNLAAFFEALTDGELTRRIVGGTLSDEALPFAQAEARSRGLGLLAPLEPLSTDGDYAGDMVELQSGLSPQEAQVFAAMLQTAGINATAGDTNLVQAHPLLAVAVGGCRVRVPKNQLRDANELLEAFRKGELELGDDFNPDAPVE